MKHLPLASLLLTIALGSPAVAGEPSPSDAKVEPILTRLFFQDRDAGTIRWANVRAGKTPTLDAVGDVEGFPKLDDGQRLVQMKDAGGFLLVGIRDDAGGESGSGWVLFGTGVEEEDHGNHAHWYYPAAPVVRHAQIDTAQGNPAHLYVYDGVFYLANDRNNGYTRLDPAAVPKTGDVPVGFHKGGGGHITLAVTNGVGYGTWIDREGPNAGRVDVTRVKPQGHETIASSFTLPKGSLHGATSASGKVFFAPSDGICWTTASVPTGSVTVHQVSLGTDPDTDRPRRTGAFTVHRNRVLFVTGVGKDAMLGILDAREASPELVTIPLNGATGTKPVSPACVRTSRGKHYAFVFHDAEEAADDEPGSAVPAEWLTIVDLDPNDDDDFTDGAIARAMEIGRSAVAGHSGHRSVAFDSDGRRAYIANPGDGTITVLMLATLQPIATCDVGGTPESVIAVGGRTSRH